MVWTEGWKRIVRMEAREQRSVSLRGGHYSKPVPDWTAFDGYEMGGRTLESFRELENGETFCPGLLG